MKAGELDKAQIADILMKEYALQKQEMWMHVAESKTNIKFFQLTIAGLAIAASFFVTANNLGTVQEVLGVPGWGLLLTIAIVFTTTVFYFVGHIMEAHFSRNIIRERMMMIEDKINELVGEEIMCWDRVITREVYKFDNELKWIHPDNYMAALTLVIVLGAGAVLPICAYWTMLQQGIVPDKYIAFPIGFMIYTVIVALGAVWIGSKLTSARDKARGLIARRLASNAAARSVIAPVAHK